MLSMTNNISIDDITHDVIVCLLYAALDDAEVWRHLRSQPNSVADVTELILQRLQTDGWFPWTVRLLQPVAGSQASAVQGWPSSQLSATAAHLPPSQASLVQPGVSSLG